MCWHNKQIKTKEKLLTILTEGGKGEIASLWKGEHTNRNYRQYEVEGFGEGRKLEDGTENNYPAVYSLNDGQVSNAMREGMTRAIQEIGVQNVWVYTNPRDGKEYANCVYFNGTNGVKNNALDAMRQAADKLEQLQSFTVWATMFDVFCDVSDDVYCWYSID